MKPTFIQVLTSKDNRTYLYISIAIGILVFWTSANETDFKTRMLLSILIPTILFLVMIISEFLNEIRHFDIIKSAGFKKLIQKGFTINKVNNYIGLTGNFKSYIIDIYYDPHTYIKYKIYEGIVINFYFQPPLFYNEKEEISKFELLYEKHKTSNWGLKPYQFYWSYGTLILKDDVGFFNPSYKKLVRRLELVIQILKEEKFEPISREELKIMRKKHDWVMTPEILRYYE